MLLRGTPVCFQQYLRFGSCERRLSGVGICLAGLIGCNRLITLHILINIHILVFFCSVSGSTCVFCVDGPCSCVFLCPYVHGFLSLSFPPSITCSSIQDPGGPASFSTHARSNATALHTVVTKVSPEEGRLLMSIIALSSSSIFVPCKNLGA